MHSPTASTNACATLFDGYLIGEAKKKTSPNKGSVGLIKFACALCFRAGRIYGDPAAYGLTFWRGAGGGRSSWFGGLLMMLGVMARFGLFRAGAWAGARISRENAGLGDQAENCSQRQNVFCHINQCLLE
jgi:hypothetical protein